MTASPAVVPDLNRALSDYMARWMTIPAEQRRQLLTEQAQLRKDRR